MDTFFLNLSICSPAFKLTIFGQLTKPCITMRLARDMIGSTFLIKYTSFMDNPLVAKISFSFSASTLRALCTFSNSASAILFSLSLSLAAFLS